MSKITFRADDALVERLDDLDASKSEVMREALREFLDRQPGATNPAREGESSSADPVAARVDELLGARLAEDAARDVNVNISLDGSGAATVEEPTEETEDDDTCSECGHTVDEGHAYCPNCGEEHQQPHCECGEAVEADWAFCPGCGRRSPTSDVFESA
jgi:Arc/MetJ-type ribon-helix-helix transcriptional regulator/RNA polymerase subunit RPABC4/transcription elongation factor Spt4